MGSVETWEACLGNGFCGFMRISLQEGNRSESRANAFRLGSTGLGGAELGIERISSVRVLRNFGSTRNWGNGKTSKKNQKAVCFRAAR